MMLRKSIQEIPSLPCKAVFSARLSCNLNARCRSCLTAKISQMEPGWDITQASWSTFVHEHTEPSHGTTVSREICFVTVSSCQLLSSLDAKYFTILKRLTGVVHVYSSNDSGFNNFHRLSKATYEHVHMRKLLLCQHFVKIPADALDVKSIYNVNVSRRAQQQHLNELSRTCW